MISSNSQSRPGWYVVVAMLVLMVLLQLIEPPTLRYQHDWLKTGEYWRLLSAHWVHVNWIHLLLNAAGLILCMTLTTPLWSASRWLSYQLIFALGISLLFSAFNPELDWYVGYSGILYGVFLLAAVDLYHRDKLVSVLLAAAIVIKIAIEQSGELNITTSDIIGSPVIVDAHLYGVIMAVAIVSTNRLNTLVRARELTRSK